MTSHAAWHSLKGTARIAAEHKHMQKLVSTGGMPQVSDIEFVQDQINVWQFKLRNFDTDLPGGLQLNKDLQQLKIRYGLDHILMEIRFPACYPTKPFFMRVVKPRMVMYTGHVTAGGSICIESLTQSGRPSGWQSYYSVETILMEVIANMVDCPVVYVQTPTGPGGMSGPLRVDFSFGTREYSLAEAQQAFARTEANHRATGWGPSVPLSAPAAPLPAPLPTAPINGFRHFASFNVGTQSTTAHITLQPPPHIGAFLGSAMPAIATANTMPGGAAAAQTSPVQHRALKRKCVDITAFITNQPQPDVIDLTSPVLCDAPAATRKAKRNVPSLTATRSTLANNGLLVEGSQKPILDLTISDSDNDESIVVTDKAGHRKNSPAGNARRQTMQGSLLSENLQDVHREKEELAKQKAELEKQKEELQKQVEQLEKERGLGFAPIPSHWTVTPITPTGKVEYIELPLPSPCSRAAAGLSSAVYNDQHMVDQESVEELESNGISRSEAIEILREADGDIEEAMVLMVERMCGDQHASKNKETVDKSKTADKLEREREAGLAESEAVLRRLEQGGVNRQWVKRIERVQNLKLWTAYQRRLLEVQEEAGGNANEMELWHGTATNVIATITKEGFDVRVAKLNGAQGAGTYFAVCSSYSHSYSAQFSTSGFAGMGMMSTANLNPGYAVPIMPPPVIPPPMTYPWSGLGFGAGIPNTSQMAQMALAQLAAPPPPPAPPPPSGFFPAVRLQPSPGVHKPSKHDSKSQAARSKPNFLDNGHAMLLCKVAIGKAGNAGQNARKPPHGYQSSTLGGSQYTVYDNDQAYPAYIVHYTTTQ